MANMYHLLMPPETSGIVSTKQLCDLNQVMKKRNQYREETSFEGEHLGKPSDFHLLEEMRKRRQQRF